MRIAYILLFIVAFSQQAICQSGKYLDNEHSARSSLQHTPAYEDVRYERTFSLPGNTSVSISSPKRWESLARIFETNLKNFHEEFSNLFGDIPSFSVGVRIMEEENFFLKTKAPRWTNALYYKKEIMIPVHERIEYDDVEKALKHEFSHAIIHSLSGGRCPGWLDEGLAQWVEGDENPALARALDKWLDRNDAISLRLLQGGFTKLQTRMVPAAYAQSLFSVNAIISSFGIEKLKVFFKELRNGVSENEAFRKSFDLDVLDYERYLRVILKKWHRS